MIFTKKSLTMLLGLALLLGLFPAGPFAPITARAANAATLTAQLNAISGLTASASGSIVAVTGSVIDANTTLTLNINSNVTVKWKADYSGTALTLIEICGDGTFEVAAGGTVENTGNGNAISNNGGTTAVTGGTVAAASGNAICIVNDGVVAYLRGTCTGNMTVIDGVIVEVDSLVIPAARHNTSVGLVIMGSSRSDYVAMWDATTNPPKIAFFQAASSSEATIEWGTLVVPTPPARIASSGSGSGSSGGATPVRRLSLQPGFSGTTLTIGQRYGFTVGGPGAGTTPQIRVSGGTLVSADGLKLTVMPDGSADKLRITVSAEGFDMITVDYDVTKARGEPIPAAEPGEIDYNPSTGR